MNRYLLSRRRLLRIGGAVLSCALILAILSAPAMPGPLEEEYSPGAIRGFAAGLLSAREYYRAIVELRRLSSLHPDSLSRERLYISELYLLYMGGQYAALDSLEYTGGDISVACAASLLRTDALFMRESPLSGNPPIVSAVCGDPLDSYLWKRRLISRLLSRDLPGAETLFATDRMPAGVRNDRQKYLDLVASARERSSAWSDPYIALWAGIAPGMGYVYAGNTSTGIVALIVISVFSAITVASFRTDNQPLGIVTGAVTAFFYGGSMAGGYMESRRHNALMMSSLRDRLSEEMSLQEDRDAVFRNYGAGLPAPAR